MKNFNLVLILVLINYGLSLSAQIVSFTDVDFKTALLNHNPVIDLSGDGEIQVSEAAAFTGMLDIEDTINGFNPNIITNLVGIEAFINLDSLNCSGNRIDDLDFSQNTQLVYLDCSDNTSIFANPINLNISQNTMLSYLNCGRSDYDSLDLSNNAALTHLIVNDIYLDYGDLDVSMNPALTYFENQSGGSGWNEVLDFSNNPLLSTIKIHGLNMDSFIFAPSNSINDLSCVNCSLDNLDLSLLSNLTTLNCSFNYLNSLNLSQNSALDSLNCSLNDLTNLDVSLNTALSYLDCASNQLTSLNVSQNPLLDYLSCDHNDITSLDLSQNTALTSLYYGNNNLSSLDLSQNLALENLYCGENPNLTSLDFSQNTALTYFAAINTSFSIVDLSPHAALNKMQCHSNDSLEYLLLNNGNNANMDTSNYGINIHSNPNLICISVDDPVFSTQYWGSSVSINIPYNANCTNCVIFIDSIQDVSCVDSGRIWTSYQGGIANSSWTPISTASVISASELAVSQAGIYTLSITDTSGCQGQVSTIINAPQYQNDFDVTVAGFTDVAFRPGLTGELTLIASNLGCVPVSGQLELTFSGPITYDLAYNHLPDLVSGNTLTWNFSNWSSDYPQFINYISFAVDSTANLGDSIVFNINISPSNGDVNTTNNSFTLIDEVVNSYDPNDKRVTPEGKCNPNYILNDEKLSYVVRFQNTGNAEAIDVYILDSLDADLDLNSLKIIAQSHEPMVTEINSDNVIKFRFDNILLPDSFSNEQESHGFVVYEIDALPGLANGTEINNSAAIYFDLNEPIITNTVLNTIIDIIPSYQSEIFDTILDTTNYTLPNGTVVTDAGIYETVIPSNDNCDSTVVVNLAVKSTVGIKDRFDTAFNLSLYPNPASSSFTLKIKEADQVAYVEVQNVLGQKVYTASIENKETTIQTNDWNNGIYHILVKSDEGVLLARRKLMVVRK